MKRQYVMLITLWAMLSFSPIRVLAVPVTYVIEGVFGSIVRETGGVESTVFNEFMSIQFTVTDPTELFDSLLNPNIGEFSVSSAFVTVPAFGLAHVPITNSDLTFFQADIDSLEQFALLFQRTSESFNFLLATEIGLDFIVDPNQPLPLKFDLSDITLDIAGVPLLTLADGSSLRFGVDLAIGNVPHAAIKNVHSTVVIDGCDSGVPNTMFPSGFTISDLIAVCAEGASNHGQFVSCVSHVTNDLKKAGTITGQQKGAIQSCAAQAHIP